MFSYHVPRAWQPQEVFCLVIGPTAQWKNCQSWRAEPAACSEIYQVMILPLSEIHFVAFLLLTSALACHRSQHAWPSFLFSNVFDITGNWKVLKPREDIQWGRSPPAMVQNTRARSRSGVHAAEPWVLWRVGEGDCLQVTGNSNLGYITQCHHQVLMER